MSDDVGPVTAATPATATLSRRRLDAGVGVHCEQVRHVYGSGDEAVVALDHADFTVSPGESVALLGPSGSGKSTLLSLLAGLLRPTEGHLFIGGDDVSQMTESDLLAMRANRVGVVVQNPGRNLLGYGTAVDNVRFAQRGTRRHRRGELPEAHELLDRVGLGHLAHQRIAAMSGGEQQRLAVTVGLANAPGLLLADEPTSQLDGRNRDAVVELLANVANRFGTTVIAVTHDPEVAAALGRTITIEDGRTHEQRQHREQHTYVGADGVVTLPPDVLATLPPGSRVRVVRRPTGVELVRDDLPERP